MSSEKRLIADSRKLQALRERIRDVVYMTATEVLAHLNLSRDTLDGIPREVLPWAPAGSGKARMARRYHPADVAAYPARARRWRDAEKKGTEAAVLETMRAELEERDARLIQEALAGDAA